LGESTGLAPRRWSRVGFSCGLASEISTEIALSNVLHDGS
jgi:hypothetical protein